MIEVIYSIQITKLFLNSIRRIFIFFINYFFFKIDAFDCAVVCSVPIWAKDFLIFSVIRIFTKVPSETCNIFTQYFTIFNSF